MKIEFCGAKLFVKKDLCKFIAIVKNNVRVPTARAVRTAEGNLAPRGVILAFRDRGSRESGNHGEFLDSCFRRNARMWTLQSRQIF